MKQASRQTILALMLLAGFGLPAHAGSVTVCNALPEDLNGLQFYGSGTPDAVAGSEALKPGACAKWSDTPESGEAAIHYILGKDGAVMLCSVPVPLSGSALIRIAPDTHANCLR